MAEDGKFLTFELGDQLYAIDISYIKEILNGCGNISPVPEFPEYSRGIVNLRGDIVPIIDMRRRFNLPEFTDLRKVCIIVTESKGAAGSDYLGFAVDKVDEVNDFVGAEISPAPKISSATSKYVTGVYKADGKIIMILDPVLLLTDSMVEAIDKYMGNK